MTPKLNQLFYKCCFFLGTANINEYVFIKKFFLLKTNPFILPNHNKNISFSLGR